ncbi:hypothetical protein HYPSUDRAFT_33480 [Hypholoma sublateritium FD-334 SS-4]|uniref:Uncharacterized protein n=1 Tax=Hypholoma sublateritium (strain FD-334 SS-4) TaxID=945553 RepID=A0A0D2PKU5_HYPSF|nr:hypothetical protein HYPSUDRAFT_33480 [Hypholoma sublateritium FD-334 SS-4]
MHSTRIIAIAALAASAAAQSLSTQCTGALTAVATNPDAASCLSLGSLITLVSGGSTTAVIPPIDAWLTSLCGGPACSNTTIAAVVQNITTGCSTELSGLGITSDSASSITPLIEQYYPAVRQVVCLKDGSTNCVTETLTNIQNSVGTLTLTSIAQIVANPPSTIPTNVTCTDCIKAAYNIINDSIPGVVSDAAPSLQSQCGTSFTDGTTPSDIVESASTASASSSTTTTSAAMGFVSFSAQGALAGLGASATIVLTTVFAFLA